MDFPCIDTTAASGMPFWKRFLLGGYYHATLPARIGRAHARVRAGMAPVMIVFYHRVADDAINDWTMPTPVFRRQLAYLRTHFDVVSLEEAQRRIRIGANSRPTVSITFDDGYADNCHHAIPLLVKDGIPCTYFVSTRYVLDRTPFPHDVTAGRPLAPNTVEQLRAMSDAGIEIGAHTRTHADLGRVHNPRRLREEIIDAKNELCAAVGRPIRYFAFPFGLHANLNREAFAMARDAGYLAVCSAYGGYNFPGDDPFHLQRIHADVEMIRLKNWLSVDPRKQRNARRFEYEPKSARPEPFGPRSKGATVR